MMLGTSIVRPESEDSKALNIQYPNAIDGDAIRKIDATYGAQTWLKYGGEWSIDPQDDRFPVKRIIADLTGAFSSPTRARHSIFSDILAKNPSMNWNDEVTRVFNQTYPGAVDGDAVIFFGALDRPELWVKYGSIWSPGWLPGSGPGMTMEYRQDYKRIIDDQTKSVTMPSVGVTTATNVDAGKLALIGLIGFLLLRGAIK